MLPSATIANPFSQADPAALMRAIAFRRQQEQEQLALDEENQRRAKVMQLAQEELRHNAMLNDQSQGPPQIAQNALTRPQMDMGTPRNYPEFAAIQQYKTMQQNQLDAERQMQLQDEQRDRQRFSTLFVPAIENVLKNGTDKEYKSLIEQMKTSSSPTAQKAAEVWQYLTPPPKMGGKAGFSGPVNEKTLPIIQKLATSQEQIDAAKELMGTEQNVKITHDDKTGAQNFEIVPMMKTERKPEKGAIVEPLTLDLIKQLQAEIPVTDPKYKTLSRYSQMLADKKNNERQPLLKVTRFDDDTVKDVELSFAPSPQRIILPKQGGGKEKTLSGSDIEKLDMYRTSYELSNDLASTYKPEYTSKLAGILASDKIGDIQQKVEKAYGNNSEATDWWMKFWEWTNAELLKQSGKAVTESELKRTVKAWATPASAPKLMTSFLKSKADKTRRSYEGMASGLGVQRETAMGKYRAAGDKPQKSATPSFEEYVAYWVAQKPAYKKRPTSEWKKAYEAKYGAK